MADRKANASMQQYEPPRIPESWDTKGKKFAQQIQDIFDDIYKRFGRLSVKDLSPQLREEIAYTVRVADDYEDPEGRVSSLESEFTQIPGKIEAQVREETKSLDGRVSSVETSIAEIPGQITSQVKEETKDLSGKVSEHETKFTQLTDTIKATVNENGVTTTSATMDSDGVAIKSQGNFTVDAGGFVGIDATDQQNSHINLGDTFSANAQTGVTAAKAVFGSLFVGGKEVVPSDMVDIEVSEERPARYNLLWIKPTTQSQQIIQAKEVRFESDYISERAAANRLMSSNVVTMDLNGSDTLESGAEAYSYALSFLVQNVGSTPSYNLTLRVQLTNGIDTVDFGSVTYSGTIKQWDIITFMAPAKEAFVNLCSGYSMQLRITTLSGGNASLYIDRYQSITAVCRSKATSGGGEPIVGALPCEVYWIP